MVSLGGLLMRWMVLASLALCAVGAFAQTSNEARTYTFSQPKTQQELQEIASVLTYIDDLKPVSVNAAAQSISVQGTSEQIGLSDWLIDVFEKQTPGIHEFQLSTPPGDTARVFFLDPSFSIQEFQEIVTAVRATADIRRVFTYSKPRAVVSRGTPDQMALAEWMLAQLGNPTSGPHMYDFPGSAESAVSLLYLKQPELQDIATTVRSTAMMRRLFTVNAPRSIAMRGTPDEIALGTWLINELDRPNPNQASSIYAVAGSHDVVQVFYLRQAATTKNFQAMAQKIRTETQLRQAFTYNASRALVLRGSPGQIAQAGSLIQAGLQ